jgi:hypothetical protein
MIRESHQHYRRRRYRSLADLWWLALGIFIGLAIGWAQPLEASEPEPWTGPISESCVQGRWVVQVDPETEVTLPISCTP